MISPTNGTMIAAPVRAAAAALLTLDPSNPYSAFVLHLSSTIGTVHALGS
jgi:hypothetical protein